MRLMECRAGAGDLAGRVILVTGAGQGLGRAAALQLAAAGATVLLHGRQPGKLEAVYDAIETAGGAQPALLPLDLDAADDAAYAAIARSIQATCGRLDGILHAASHLKGLMPLELQTAADFNTTLRVNLVAPFALIRYCLPLLRAATDASVVLVSETHAAAPGAWWGGFALAKQGLSGLATIFSEETQDIPGLRFNTFVPGPMHSPQRLRTHPAEDKQALPHPDDLAPLLTWLLGPGSRRLQQQILTPASEV